MCVCVCNLRGRSQQRLKRQQRSRHDDCIQNTERRISLFQEKEYSSQSKRKERGTRRCKKLVILEGELITYGLYSKKGQMFRIVAKGNGRELNRNKRINSVQKTTKVRNHTFVVVSI